MNKLYISRKAAMYALMYEANTHSNPVKKAYTRAAAIIEQITPEDVQPVKHGRWIWVKNYRDCEGDIYSQYKCSCCNFGVGGVYSAKDLTHFCGNCGARMDLEKR